MPPKYLFSAVFLFIFCVLGSKQEQNGDGKIPKEQENTLENMPSWYFGFHFMLPFHHHKAVPDSILKELRSIFQELHAQGPTSLKNQQVRYGKVISFLESQCVELCKKNTITPHPIFKVDQRFCESLRPKMLRWYRYLSIFLPKMDVYIMDVDDTDNIEVFEGDLSLMGYTIITSFGYVIERISKDNLENMNAALEVLADISSTFELKLLEKYIAGGFRFRVQSLLSLYLKRAFGPFNIDPTGTEASETFPLDRLEMFFDCRYTQRLSITKCAPHVLESKNGASFSLIDLVSLIHHEQILFHKFGRFSQKFLRFLLNGLIKEFDTGTPIAIDAKLKEHIFQKVPVIANADNNIANSSIRSKLLLPQMFSEFLKTQRAHVHDGYALHYTFFSTNRLLKKSEFEFSTELLTSDEDNKASFFGIYMKFMKIMQNKGYLFKSLHNASEDVVVAMGYFLEELSGYDDFHEILRCTFELIDFYEDQQFLEEKEVDAIKETAAIWFNPDYLREYWSI